MSRHKSHILDKKCMCSQCELRFSCFTEERIFSDPIFQGLFEALMAKGRTKEQALEEVSNEIKLRIKSPVGDSVPYIPYIYPPGTAAPSQTFPWTTSTITITGDPSWTCTNDCVNITYHMSSGEDVSWNANISELNKIR